MKRYKGEFRGSVLGLLAKALDQSPAALSRLLSPHGLQTINDDTWYDLELARSLMYDMERVVGSRALYNIGVNIGMTVPLVESTNVNEFLADMDAGYRRNVRGEDIGSITVVADGERSVRATFSVPFPCYLDQGVCTGHVRRFGEMPLLEHMTFGCRDQGAPSCSYRVCW